MLRGLIRVRWNDHRMDRALSCFPFLFLGEEVCTPSFHKFHLRVSRQLPTMSATSMPGADLTDNRGPQVIKAIAACTGFSGLTFAGRVVSRKLLKAEYLVSDDLVALGFLGAWLESGLGVWGKHHHGLMLLRQKVSLRGLAHSLQT